MKIGGLLLWTHESWQVLVTPVLMAELLDMFRQPCSLENHFWYEYSEISVSVYNRHSWIKNNMFIHEYCTHRFSLNQSNLEKLTKRDTEINKLTVPRDLVRNIRSLIYANIRNVKKKTASKMQSIICIYNYVNEMLYTKIRIFFNHFRK